MKVYFVFFMTLIAGMEVSAIDNDDTGHTFSIGTTAGILYGQAEEIVFISKNSDDKLSQLLWNFKPLVYAGVDVHYNWQKPAKKIGFFTDATVKFGIPGGTGIMEDRDWTHSVYSDFLTHYSVHDNKTEKAILGDLNIGLSFKIREKYFLKPFISYSYMTYSWTASRGSFLYPIDEAGNEGHGYMDRPIDVGTYEQTWNLLSIGISFAGAFNRFFSTDISLKFSPFIWCNTVDNHILRDLIITEKLNGGFCIEPSFALAFTPKDWFSLALSVTYKNISNTRGDGDYDFSDGQTSDITIKDMVGSGYSAFDVGINARFRVLKR